MALHIVNRPVPVQQGAVHKQKGNTKDDITDNKERVYTFYSRHTGM